MSYFISQLIDKSYRIGVNEKVESALDGALQIASDNYQMHKKLLQELIEKIDKSDNKSDSISKILENENQSIKFKLLSIKKNILLDDNIVPIESINIFLAQKKLNLVWPAEDRQKLYALVNLGNRKLLQIVYPLPQAFRESAREIQEVSQIYKTLGFAQDEIRQSFLLTFIFIYAIGLMVGLIVSFWFSKKITRPVEALKAAASEIGKGNLQHRIAVDGKDELAELGNAFNKMAAELSENQRKIIELEKMATWQQLARRLAHEIKNPLTPIQLMSQQIRDNYKGEDRNYKNMLSECCSIIEQEVESLKNLVQEFSDFARLPEIHPTENNICDLVISVARLYQTSEIKVEIPKSELMVSFDYDYMKRVLINLVDNALAATNSNEPITIKVERNKKSIILTVSDKGEGISEENIQRIFEPYFSTKISGVGLGLSIVKKIVEEHGGSIEVESKLGEWTTFILTLKDIL
ncbi:ATP-binding protein [Calditrichota bacterium]